MRCSAPASRAPQAPPAHPCRSAWTRRCPGAAWHTRPRRAAGLRPAAAGTRSRPVGLPRRRSPPAPRPPAAACGALGPAQGTAQRSERGAGGAGVRAGALRGPGHRPSRARPDTHLPLGGAVHAEARASHATHVAGRGRRCSAVQARGGGSGGGLRGRAKTPWAQVQSAGEARRQTNWRAAIRFKAASRPAPVHARLTVQMPFAAPLQLHWP